MERAIGTCSECGGPVVIPMMAIHPVATCGRCGATAESAYGAVIPMKKGSGAQNEIVRRGGRLVVTSWIGEEAIANNE